MKNKKLFLIFLQTIFFFIISFACARSNNAMTLSHEEDVTGFDFSPDGNYTAVAFKDNIKIWDINSNRIIKHIPRKSFHYINKIIYYPDMKHLVTGGDKIRVYRISDGSVIKTLGHDEHNDNITSIALAADNQLIVAGCQYKWMATMLNSNSVKVFNDNRSIVKVDFPPTPLYFLVASHNKNVKVWDSRTGRNIKTYNFNNYVFDAAFHPNGKYIIVSVIKDGIHFIDISNDKTVLKIPIKTNSSRIAIHSNGHFLAYTESIFQGRSLHGTDREHYTTRSGQVASRERHTFIYNQKHKTTVFIINLAKNKVVQKHELETGLIVELKFSKSGNKLGLSTGKNVILWNTGL